MTTSVWQRSDPPPRPARHVVAAGPHFVHGERAEVAPMDCACGWSGLVGGWDAHRKGQPSVSRAPTELEAFERVPAERGGPAWRERLSANSANGRKTHCPARHEYTPENTYIEATATGDRRACKTCVRARQRERDRARARLVAVPA